MDEQALIDKLMAIHRLRVGATTSGEARAAAAAFDRVSQRLEELRAEQPVPYKFSLHDPWARKLFLALLRKHGLRPYRRRGQHRTTVRVDAPEQFVDEVLWPEFLELQDTLYDYLAEMTDRVIGEALGVDGSEPDEAAEPAGLPFGTRGATGEQRT